MLEHEEEGWEERRAHIAKFQATLRRNRIQRDGFVLKKSEAALKYRDHVAIIRQCHQELLEAEIRHIEAKSDFDSLDAKTGAIREHLEDERKQVALLEGEAQRVKEKARNALDACNAIVADAEDPSYYTTQIEAGLTVEALERDITAEEAKLEFIHATNPNAIRDFERRQLEVDKMKDRIGEADEKLEKLNRRITQTRSVWEPALDALISEISEAFSYNFEQIGCAGEVGIKKTEDFDEWAIEIKVKFRYKPSHPTLIEDANISRRENETLQILDAHRQSGGERSVSTIFYLLALQSLARAPFRVVDEINQGMDPRNERMVHERMVEIACREHTSQYFLITPKLLTGLRYDKRMKVLCIASGEHMPDDYKQLDVKKIISIRRAIMAAA
jgi:chromosome segregation ATPase